MIFFQKRKFAIEIDQIEVKRQTLAIVYLEATFLAKKCICHMNPDIIRVQVMYILFVLEILKVETLLDTLCTHFSFTILLFTKIFFTFKIKTYVALSFSVGFDQY